MLVIPHSFNTAANLNILDVDRAAVAVYLRFVILNWRFTKMTSFSTKITSLSSYVMARTTTMHICKKQIRITISVYLLNVV